MNPADRQPSGNLGNFWVVARKNVELQLSCRFDRQAGVLPSEPGPGLPRLSIPNRTNGEGQLLSCVEWFAFAVMMLSP